MATPKPAKHLTREQVKARLSKSSTLEIPGFGTVTRHKVSVEDVRAIDELTGGDAAAAAIWTVIKSFPDLFEDSQESYDLLAGDAMTLGVFARAIDAGLGAAGDLTFR